MTAHHTLSGREAGAIAQHGRYLLRRRVITPFQYALLDVMIWGVRKPGRAAFIVPWAVLTRLTGQGRSTVAEGIKRLEELGFVQRTQRRVRVAWVAGATASRQIANSYRLLVPDTGSSSRTAREQPSVISILETPIAVVRAAQEALAEMRRAMEVRLLRKGNG